MSENLEKIRPALVALEVGESVSFSISRLKSVRTQASELGAITTVSSRPGLTGKTKPSRSNEQYRKPNQVYMKILQFLDHLIPYETFLNDLSSRIVRQLKADKDDPEFIS